MKTVFKKLLSSFLSIVMLTTIVPATCIFASGLSRIDDQTNQDIIDQLKRMNHEHYWGEEYTDEQGNVVRHCLYCSEVSSDFAPINEVFGNMYFKPREDLKAFFLIQNAYKGFSIEGSTYTIHVKDNVAIRTMQPITDGNDVIPTATVFHASDFTLDPDSGLTTLCLSFNSDGSLSWGKKDVSGSSNTVENLVFAISSEGGISSIADFLVNASPMNLKAEPHGNKSKNEVMISWDEPKLDNLSRYFVYSLRNGQKKFLGVATGTSYYDKTADPDAYNYYWVFPVVTDANKTNYIGSCPQYVYAKGGLPSPERLRASNAQGYVRIYWDRVVGAEGYLIYGIVGDKPYGYVGMTSSLGYSDFTASSEKYNFYWVYPYYKDANGKIIAGTCADKYVYGIAK